MDQGKKFHFYSSMASLVEYVLIDSQELGARVYRKGSDGVWLISSEAYEIEGCIEIRQIELILKMSDIYAKTIGIL